MSDYRHLDFAPETSHSFNPFDSVKYQSKILPDSRTLHTSLWEKIVDTFRVFDGDTSLYEEDPDNKPHGHFTPFNSGTRLGLIDYATLGIFRLIHALNTLIINQMANNDRSHYAVVFFKKLFLIIPRFALAIIHGVANGLIRHTVSAILTIALLLPIVISHTISTCVGYLIARKIAKEITVQESSALGIGSAMKKMHEILMETSYRNAIVKKISSTNTVRQPVQDKFLLELFDSHSVLKGQKEYSETSSSKEIEEQNRLILGNKSARQAILGMEACKPRVSSDKSTVTLKRQKTCLTH
jgi:hypothetical protein